MAGSLCDSLSLLLLATLLEWSFTRSRNFVYNYYNIPRIQELTDIVYIYTLGEVDTVVIQSFVSFFSTEAIFTALSEITDAFDWFEIDGEGATDEEWNLSLNERGEGAAGWNSEKWDTRWNKAADVYMIDS